ncbi:MAG: extracellular solute-binding protein [Alphaproteobacteria bacterium]|nr:extracellular solute-binding protein [Alphaproteobacteria bacterium]
MRSGLIVGAAGFLLPILVSCTTFAETLSPASISASMHGIAMHGEPKYANAFTHFDYVNPEAPRGGDLRVAPIGTFDTLNPYSLAGVPAAGVSGHVFESLLTRSKDEPFTLYGLLAERIEVPDDRSWITFHLNPKARFHNGASVTVDDVIFSWELLKEKGLANQRGFYRRVEAVEQVGSLAVRMRFARPMDREMPLIMGLMAVLPRAVYQALNFERLGMTQPVGSGPYRLASVDPGRSVGFVRDPDYWGQDLAVRRGRDNFATIRYDYYRDANAAFEAFKTGTVSLRLEPDPARWATGYGFPAMRSGKTERGEITHGRPSGMYGIAMNSRRTPFNDRAVREAFILAFDFEWANRTLFHGSYARTRSFFDNSVLASKGAIDASERAVLGRDLSFVPASDRAQGYQPPTSRGTGRNRKNLRRAQALLDKAGLVVRGEARVDPRTGKPVVLELLLVNPRDERLALTYADSLATLGITLRLRTVDMAQYQRRLLDFDFDMIIHHWAMSLSPGNEQEHYWSSAAASRAGSRNYPGIQSPAIDKMVGKITAARDRRQFTTVVKALDRLLLAGRYVVPLFHLPADRLAWWSGFRRPRMTPLYGFSLDTWWWDPVAVMR